MWLHCEYRAGSLFSFRLGEATATGAKTLLIPTPFAVRTALLDAVIRADGAETAREAFGQIKRLTLAVRPTARTAISRLFTRVRKPKRSDGEQSDEGNADGEAMASTIAFREYVHLDGILGLAFESKVDADLAWAEQLAPRLSYFGKRGSFFQLSDVPRRSETLLEGYVRFGDGPLLGTEVAGFAQGVVPVGTLQLMDDWGPDLTWEKLNVFSKEKIRLGRERIRKPMLLPCRLIRSSRNFGYYERIEPPSSSV